MRNVTGSQVMVAAKSSIPLVPRSAIKHYWSATLDDLKQDSKDTFDLWVAAGKPKKGAAFDVMKNTKYKHKLAVRDAVKSFEQKFGDELLDNFLSKDMHTFWKSCRSKCGSNAISIPNVDDITSLKEIASLF
jgi:hypothetical protein